VGPIQSAGVTAGPAGQTLPSVRNRVLNTLNDAGLQPSLPLRLRFGPDDKITVVGDHTESAAIERAIEQDAELVEMFRQLRAAQQQPSLDLTIGDAVITDGQR
jgi:hypothetical protein